MRVELKNVMAKTRNLLVKKRPDEERATVAYDPNWEPTEEPQPTFSPVISQLCTYAQMEHPAYRQWCAALDEPWHVHRKLWEWCYIGQACRQAGALGPGRRGLGFGVGTEPLASYFASQGSQVVATDLPDESAKKSYWEANNEHAKSLASLNPRGLCSDEQMRALVSFLPVDMTEVPDDLVGFDYVWSSCAMEHLGSLEAGLDFVRASLQCVKPGGLAVHTTEYNVSSNDETIATGDTVAYRRRDMEALIGELRSEGHSIESTFALGTASQDRYVDTPPWTEPHLKIPLGPFVITSFGLIVTKAGDRSNA